MGYGWQLDSDQGFSRIWAFHDGSDRWPMPELISFDEAMSQTNDKECSLLIGNGFSIDYFRYSTLLDNAGLEVDDPLGRLFHNRYVRLRVRYEGA